MLKAALCSSEAALKGRPPALTGQCVSVSVLQEQPGTAESYVCCSSACVTLLMRLLPDTCE